MWIRLGYNIFAFLDSTPVNGDSEQKREDAEVEEKPKSPQQDESNDHPTSSPNRFVCIVLLCSVFFSSIYIRRFCLKQADFSWLWSFQAEPRQPC